MPMGDASSALPDQGAPAPMNQEPVPPVNDPALEGDSPIDDAAPEMSGKVKEIADIAGEISEKDQETALAYLRSLKDASEENAQQAGGAVAQDANMPDAPIQESVIFTKKQIKKINEALGDESLQAELDKKEPVGRSTKTNNKLTSPFDPPKNN